MRSPFILLRQSLFSEITHLSGIFEWFFRLAIYSLLFGDSLLFHHATPYSQKYRTVDTYLDHANDMRTRMVLENPLSTLSGIQWSRQDIFAEPRGQNPVTQNGQPILGVNIMNPAQTGMPPITPDELSSITLGSFQPRLVRSYVIHQR